MSESKMLFARIARRTLVGPSRAQPFPVGERESWPRLATQPRPVSRPVFSRLFFPCSAPKSPDKDLFLSFEIPCSVPARSRNRRIANQATS